MNLDGDSDDDERDEEMEAKEKTCFEQLERALMTCQKCGDSKYCKIDRNGNHVAITFQQRRSWSVALVRVHLYT